MHRILRPALATCLWLGLSPLVAGSPTGSNRPALSQERGTAAEQVQSILDEFNQARQDFGKLYSQAATDAERAAVVEAHYPQAPLFCGRLMEVLTAHPDGPEAAKGLLWVMQQSMEQDQVRAAGELMLAHHLESDELAAACGVYERAPAGGRAFLESVIERSAEAGVVARAKYSLGLHLLQRASVAGDLAAQSPAEREGYTGFYGEDVVAELLDVNVAELKREAIELLEHVREVAPEVALGGSRTLGEACDRQLFELHNLEVGMVAPEITGQDLDGVEFSLSDYRGKVVVLDFWGNW